MGNRKYIRAKQVHTIADFELLECSWFEVIHGTNFRMWHRSALENLQYHTLKSWIAQGIVFKTMEVKQIGYILRKEVENEDK